MKGATIEMLRCGKGLTTRRQRAEGQRALPRKQHSLSQLNIGSSPGVAAPAWRCSSAALRSRSSSRGAAAAYQPFASPGFLSSSTCCTMQRPITGGPALLFSAPTGRPTSRRTFALLCRIFRIASVCLQAHSPSLRWLGSRWLNTLLGNTQQANLTPGHSGSRRAACECCWQASSAPAVH